MFVSSQTFDWFKASQEAFEMLRQGNADVRAEGDALKSENSHLRLAGDWHRAKINQLELERSALLQKAYDISIPVPQIVRQQPDPERQLKQFSFDDVGDDIARVLGIPIHGDDN